MHTYYFSSSSMHSMNNTRVVLRAYCMHRHEHKKEYLLSPTTVVVFFTGIYSSGGEFGGFVTLAGVNLLRIYYLVRRRIISSYLLPTVRCCHLFVFVFVFAATAAQHDDHLLEWAHTTTMAQIFGPNSASCLAFLAQ